MKITFSLGVLLFLHIGCFSSENNLQERPHNLVVANIVEDGENIAITQDGTKYFQSSVHRLIYFHAGHQYMMRKSNYDPQAWEMMLKQEVEDSFDEFLD